MKGDLMWIEEIKDKKGKKVYKFADRYVDPRTNRRKKVSITLPNKSRQTQKEAQQILNEKINQRLDSDTIKKPTLTFHEFLDEWQQIYKKQVRETTYYSTVSMLNAIRERIPEDYLLSGIRTDFLNELFESMLYKDDFSNQYMKLYKAKINVLFKYAKKKNYILKNPANDVVIDFKREDRVVKIKEKFLEDDEYKKLITYAMKRNKRYGLLFQWLYFTGMRIGEAAALGKDDIVITSNGAYAIVSGTLMTRNRRAKDFKKSTQTKTPAGMRNIDLPQKALKILEQAAELNKNLDTNFIFTNSKGSPFDSSSVNKFLRRLPERLNIDKPISSHIFRHTHISKLAEFGVPLSVIMERVGHEDDEITKKIYIHITQNMREKMKDDLERL